MFCEFLKREDRYIFESIKRYNFIFWKNIV